MRRSNCKGSEEINFSEEDNFVKAEVSIKKASIIIFAIAAIAIMIAIFSYFSVFNGEVSKSQEVWGLFGDFFGGTLNPLLAFLSLVAILYTLLIQARELSHSTKALQDQSEHLQTQAFESTFFSLVAMHNENIRTLDLEDSEEQRVRGRAVFRVLYGRLKDAYEADKRIINTSDEIKIIRSAYKRFYKKNQKFHGHYLRAVKKLIDYVDHRCSSNKDEYWEVIKAQLSDYELLLVFYHSICESGYVSFEFLKSKFLFENLPEEELLDIDSHSKFLGDNAE